MGPTPAFLDLEIGYNKEPDAETIRSPRVRPSRPGGSDFPIKDHAHVEQ